MLAGTTRRKQMPHHVAIRARMQASGDFGGTDLLLSAGLAQEVFRREDRRRRPGSLLRRIGG